MTQLILTAVIGLLTILFIILLDFNLEKAGSLGLISYKSQLSALLAVWYLRLAHYLI